MTWILLAYVVYVLSVVLFAASFAVSVFIVGYATVWDWLGALLLGLTPGLNTVAAIGLASWCVCSIDVVVIKGRP
jgi:hypothetical protein